MADEVKIKLNQEEALPFTPEEIFRTIADNIDQIDTESDEACLLVTETMAIILFWEGQQIIVEKVLMASELKRS
jgi:P pilus assembly chaperone PapD